MRLHRLETTQLLTVAADDAWRFFSDPSNLPRITPPWLNLTPTSEAPTRMHPGMIVTYEVAPFPAVRVAWVTEITHVVEGEFFVDEQRSGPYKFWHHQHHFRPVPGGTEVRDIVHYALPFGIVGDFIGAAAVKRRLNEIFEYRHAALERRFGSFPERQATPSGRAETPAAKA